VRLEDVYVDEVEQYDKVSLLRGRFRIESGEYSFRGIAYMGYGGPNVNIELEEDVRENILDAGLSGEELEQLIVEVQRRIIDGNFKLTAERN